jgi:hypothetical protein
MAAKELTLKFNKEKETKNTIRFQADGHEDIPYVYIMKPAVTKMGNPDSISMVIKAVK